MITIVLVDVEAPGGGLFSAKTGANCIPINNRTKSHFFIDHQIIASLIRIIAAPEQIFQKICAFDNKA